MKAVIQAQDEVLNQKILGETSSVREDMNHKLALQVRRGALRRGSAQRPARRLPGLLPSWSGAAPNPTAPPSPTAQVAENKRLQAQLAKAQADVNRLIRVAENLALRVQILEAHTGVSS